MRNIPKTGDLEWATRRMTELLLDIGRQGAMRDPIAGACAGEGLTPPQIHAVLWLGVDGPLTMGELARRGGITEKTITGIVDRMERDGLIVRQRSEVDRRVIHVRLTEVGTTTYQELRARADNQIRDGLSLLDEPEQQELVRIVEKLVERRALRRQDANPPEPRKSK